MLKVNVGVKKTGKEGVNVESMDLRLYEGDRKMCEREGEEYREKVEGRRIKGEKWVEGNVLLVVDKGKEYEVKYTGEC